VNWFEKLSGLRPAYALIILNEKKAICKKHLVFAGYPEKGEGARALLPADFMLPKGELSSRHYAFRAWSQKSGRGGHTKSAGTESSQIEGTAKLCGLAEKPWEKTWGGGSQFSAKQPKMAL